MTKAQRSLAAGGRLHRAGDHDFASSRAYYAVFYAVSALLLTRHLTFSKHTGVISAFSEHFIKTAVFPKAFSANIARLFRERQLADYEADLPIDPGETSKDLEIAKTMLSAIKKYLEQGYHHE